MKKIATTINRTSLTRKLTLLLLFTIFFQLTSKAANYYWVGGSGSWADLNHWATTSGGTGGSGIFSPPGNNDDLFFDANSGAGIIIVDLTVAVKNARNITVNIPAAVGSLKWTGNIRFQFYGDMNLVTAVDFSAYTGPIHIYQTTPTKNIYTGNNTFYSPVYFEPNQSANTVITGQYRNFSSTTLELAATTDKVTFSSSAAALGNYVEVKKGEAHFNQGLAPILLSASPNLLIRQTGSLYASNNCIASDLNNAGYVNLNEANTAPNHQFRSIDIYTVETQTVASTLDFHGSTVNITDYWRYGRSNSTLYSINATGSTLNFNSSALNFYPLEYTFNNVIVSGGGTPFRFVYEYVTSPTNPNFNLVKLERSTNMQFVSPGGVLLLPTIDSMHLIPGGEYSYRTLVNSVEIIETPGATCRFVCNKLSQVGTCEKPITINRFGYSLGSASTVHSQYIISKDIMAQGPATPYLPGTGSLSILGSHPGWDFTPIPPTSRTLVWVGAVPVNINDSTTYKRWEHSLNWRDLAFDPGAFNIATGGPGYTIGTPACPPTKVDSVVFLNNSYVRIDSITSAYTRSINWIGSGRLNATDFKKLEIWGALTLSYTMRNDFYGTVYFKSDRPYRCTIQTRSRPFRKGVVFDAALASSSWLLRDSIIALKIDPNCSGPNGAQSMRISSGHLHTGTVNCGPGTNGSLRLFGLYGLSGILSLYDSDIYILGGAGSNNVLDILGTVINPGTSHFICKNTLAGGMQSLTLGDGKHYSEITLDRTTPPVSISDFSHNVFLTKDTIQTINATVNSSPWFFTKLTSNAGLVRKLDLHTAISSRSIFTGDNGTNSDVYSMTIDSLYLYGLVYHGMRLKVRSYLNMSPGHYSYFYTTAPPLNLELMGATPAFPNNIFNSCASGTSSYSGANASINGTCTQPITLEGGIINVVSPTPVAASYLNLVNNSIIGSGGSFTNSTTSGTVTGWTGAPSTPRLLRWKDATATTNHNGNWNDPTYWEQILPNGTVLFPAPQCPPTKIDTALFDNTSFSASGQVVTLNGSYEVGSMYWRNISVYTTPPRLSGSNLTEMRLFGSLEFHQNMTNNYLGSFRFKGVPTVAHPVNHITMNQKSFQRFAYIDADADAMEWQLTDSVSFALYAPTIPLLSIYRGRLVTNGNPIYIAGGGLDLDFTTNRYFNFANSRIYCGYGNFRVLNPATATIVSTNSTITVNTGVFQGGGKVYHNVNAASGPSSFSISNGDSFNNILLSATTVNFTSILGGTGMTAKKITSNTPSLDFNTPLAVIDSMILNGATSTIRTSNKYNKSFSVKEGTTLRLGAKEVQWFQNTCNVDLIGTPALQIQFFCVTTGDTAYLRKDSASVCADFINMRDIWGVGNGVNPAGCTSFGNAVASPCSYGVMNAWVPSKCDTITDDFSACGPWTVLNTSRGRAAFTAGANANNQQNNKGWDYRPYPPVSQMVMTTSSPAICAGSSVTIILSGTAKIPFSFYYQDNLGNSYNHYITSPAQLTSYNTTNFNFVFTETQTPGASTVFTPGTVSVDRCWDNTSPIGTGSLNVTVNPIPSITNGGLTQAICSGTTGAFTATTSVPSTIAWTSPAVGGITGHSLSGSGSISEILTNSTTSPLNVVYTLTPTAAGCVGSPATHTITVNPRPNAVAGPAQNMSCIAPTATVTVSSSTPGVDYSWTGPSVTAGATTNSATVDAIGTYTVIVTNPTTGCTSSGTVAVSFIADTQAPTITCPANQTATTGAGSCAASVINPNPVTADNCGVTRLSWVMTGATSGSSPATGINNVGTQSFNLGVTTVTYTISDAVGNTTSCAYNVTVTDPIAPTVVCPDNMTANTSAASCTASVTTPNATTNDNCSVTRLTWALTGATTANSPASGINNLGTYTFNLGVTTVTYTVADAAGNTSTCSFTVTVTDNVLPTISCSGNLTANTSAVSCSASVSTSNPSIADNCSLATLTWSLTGATTANSSATGINNLGTYTFNRGITTVTYTVTDAAGNSSNCSFTVTVTDNVAPIINCPANSTANAGAVACNASVATTNPTVSDNCGIATLTWTMSGATTGASPATGINNAGTQTFNIGVTTVTYVATDASGNSSNCSFTVTISDNLAPVFGTCPANMTANTTSSTCDSPVNTPAPVVTDNCSLATLTWALTGATTGNSPASGINNLGSHTFNLGTTTVTYTATDAAGNSSTCFYTVTITDAQAPVTPTLVNVLGQCSAVVLVPTTTDNCAGIIFGTTPDPLTYNAQGTYTVTWTFNDGNGNSTTATQTVIVDNNLPPVPPSLPDVVAQCDTTLTAPVSTTNCSGPVTGTTTDPTTYSTQGTYVVTWSFDDGTGNIVTATQNVIIDDVTPPVTPVLSAISDECSVTLTAPTTTDNCVGTVTATTSDPLVYNSQGTFTVNWTFDDNNGNTSTATQTVTINDVTPPTINGCPTNIAANNDPGQCTATVNWVAPLASDNCAGVTLTSTHTSGSTFPSGTTTVTYTATDAGGNTVSCSFDVTVTENEAPVIAGCPSNITTGNDAGDCGANVSWNAPTATDNCPGVTLTSTHNPGDAFPTGTTTVTYTATDAAGNTATCSFDVTVNDTENPVIAGCPSDIAIGNTTGNCDGIASWTVPTVSDNCPGVTLTGSHAPGDVFPLGTTTVTYTATDAAGNTSAICSFDVTVTDQEDPVIAGLGDLSICEGGTVTWAPFITDNCPGVTFTSTHNPGDVFQLGTTTVSYTATDAAGNTSSTSFNVDIYPLTPLVIEMNPTEVCAGEPLNLNSPNLPSNQGATYEWSLNGVVVSTDPNYNLSSTSLLDNGVYDLVVTQPGGCESYGQFTISLNPCDIIIPEALTPNGDGSNDLFAIENLENYPNSSVQIVNRWGNVVFESDDYKNDWDGTSYSNLNIGGNQLPEGTFYYVLTIGGETDTKLYGKVYTGYVYLKR